MKTHRQRNNPLSIVVAMAICLAGNHVIASSCCPHERTPANQLEVGKGHDEHGDEHGEEDALSMSLEEIDEARCEHQTETYRCAECRYEVGVVKVPASLLKQGQSENGLIRTGEARRQKVTAGLQTTGEIRLNDNATVHVTPRIPGVVESVAVDIGARVAKGDVLFTINSTELGKTLAEYQRSRALAALSKNTYEREKKLFDQKVASEQDMIEAQMAYERHKTDLVAAEQTLHVLGLIEQDVAAREKSHGPDIGILPVRASISGTVLERHAVIGEMVEPGSDVMLLSELETLWAWVDIYERDLGLLVGGEKGGPISVDITVEAFPGRLFSGTIDHIAAVMDERTRTVKARAIVQNTDGLLHPGMFCRVNIATGAAEDVLVVPQSALLTDEGAEFVFKHWKDDYFVRRAVKSGRRFQEVVEVLDGVKAGESIVTEGAFLLKSDVLREKMGAGCAD
ncbi:MAG: efflux RND transporter periplasmic adaptor subunit [Lentisphaerae bacterium]|nr:efflux RND transporter periplasmic adaptor subunit [Lentisphaerota bacterium]